MTHQYTLVSHALCPYVQRAAIVLKEKGVAFERITIDLADKPDWFKKASPLEKVPLLKVDDDQFLFESAAIAEYLDETLPGRLLPENPEERARHRAYVEFASQILNGIGSLYSAGDEIAFRKAALNLRAKFEHLDKMIDHDGPFFSGSDFSLVDAAFGPIFRYFDVFEDFSYTGIFDGLQSVKRWRLALFNRPSVRNAVSEAYPTLLRNFLIKRNSWMTTLMAA